jgi:hypothetical protein
MRFVAISNHTSNSSSDLDVLFSFSDRVRRRPNTRIITSNILNAQETDPSSVSHQGFDMGAIEIERL